MPMHRENEEGCVVRHGRTWSGHLDSGDMALPLLSRSPGTSPAMTPSPAMSNDLMRRVQQHREGIADGFTKEHSVNMLVYDEEYATAIEAIQREKTSNIGHAMETRLIYPTNPNWTDLWDVIAR